MLLCLCVSCIKLHARNPVKFQNPERTLEIRAHWNIVTSHSVFDYGIDMRLGHST